MVTICATMLALLEFIRLRFKKRPVAVAILNERTHSCHRHRQVPLRDQSRAALYIGALRSREIPWASTFGPHFECCLPALLDDRLRIETSCLHVSTGAITANYSVHTGRDFIRVERPIGKFWKAASLFHSPTRIAITSFICGSSPATCERLR